MLSHLLTTVFDACTTGAVIAEAGVFDKNRYVPVRQR